MAPEKATSPTASKKQVPINKAGVIGSGVSGLAAAYTLAGKKSVVTGSTQGIGRCVAEQMLAVGASVLINARTASDVDATVAELSAAYPGKGVGAACDTSSREGRAALLAAGRLCDAAPPGLNRGTGLGPGAEGAEQRRNGGGQCARGSLGDRTHVGVEYRARIWHRQSAGFCGL